MMQTHLTPEYIYNNMSFEELNEIYTQLICIKNEEVWGEEWKKMSRETTYWQRRDFMKLHWFEVLENLEKKKLNENVIPLEIVV